MKLVTPEMISDIEKKQSAKSLIPEEEFIRLYNLGEKELEDVKERVKMFESLIAEDNIFGSLLKEMPEIKLFSSTMDCFVNIIFPSILVGEYDTIKDVIKDESQMNEMRQFIYNCLKEKYN